MSSRRTQGIVNNYRRSLENSHLLRHIHTGYQNSSKSISTSVKFQNQNALLIDGCVFFSDPQLKLSQARLQQGELHCYPGERHQNFQQQQPQECWQYYTIITMLFCVLDRVLTLIPQVGSEIESFLDFFPMRFIEYCNIYRFSLKCFSV